MSAERHVRIFRNGRSRAIRIPKEFDIFADEAVLREEGGRLILEKPQRRDLRDILARMKPITDEEWPEIEDRPPEPIDFS